MSWFVLLAAAATQGEQPWWAQLFNNPIVPIAVMLLLLWVFMLRGRRKEDQKRQQMISALKRGDRVQTIGGILGTVVEARETEVVVKVDENANTKIRFARSAIHRVLGEQEPTK